MVSRSEELSALVDGELSEDELAVTLARVEHDTALRAAWDAYHVIGDALRGHAGSDLAARVSRRLADEPTVVAPRRTLIRAPQRVAWYAISAAAGAAAVALVVWTAVPLVQPQPRLTAGEVPAAPIVPVVASAPAPAEAQARSANAEVEDYLLAHAKVKPRYAAKAREWRVEDSEAAPADLAKAGWVVRSAPPGFRTVGELTRTLGGTRGVGHIVLSDGLAAISVFIEPARQTALQPGLVRQGAINVYIRQLGNHRITVVGEAPADSVKYVADAVEFRK
jgi:negative regulator of sigma E activity